MGTKCAGGSVPGTLRVVLTSHAVSFCVLITLASLRGDPLPHGIPLYCGLLAGVMGGLSLTGFYIALAQGAMGVPAAVSGLLAAAIPAAISSAQEGWPGGRRIAGFVVAGVAIWMIAAGENPEAKPVPVKTTWLAILSGAGFGVYFTLLKFAGTAGIIWPMATARIGSLTTCSLFLILMAITGNRYSADRWLPRRAVLWAFSTALLDTCGNLLFIASTRAGRLDVAAVLASLYPASTILLAAWMLHERPTRRQGFGMVVAVAAVVMITL
ncbi:EamA family transporter [Edaphobacter sp. 4G125]|nr:EamA family transporter [Edaphobacter sp. 4G125]